MICVQCGREIPPGAELTCRTCEHVFCCVDCNELYHFEILMKAGRYETTERLA